MFGWRDFVRRQLIALGMLCGLLPGFVVHTHAAEAPAVSAASAVLMDAETGRVLYAHNEQEPRAIASTTKLMTALVAAEYLGETCRKPWRSSGNGRGLRGPLSISSRGKRSP